MTRDGAEASELHPRRRPDLSATELISRRRSLPVVDPELLRRDIDQLIDRAS